MFYELILAVAAILAVPGHVLFLVKRAAPCVLCLGPEQGIFQSSSAREGIFELDASQSSCVRIFARQTARFLGWKWKREGSRCST